MKGVFEAHELPWRKNRPTTIAQAAMFRSRSVRSLMQMPN